MKTKYKKVIVTNIIVISATVIFAIFSFFSMKYDLYRCAFFEAFHLYCPGCGGTRAFYALLKLDIVSSLKYNPCLLLGMAVYIYYNVRAILAIKKGDENYSVNNHYYLLVVYSVFIVVYFIFRNILLLVFHIDLMGI